MEDTLHDTLDLMADAERDDTKCEINIIAKINMIFNKVKFTFVAQNCTIKFFDFCFVLFSHESDIKCE